MGAGVRVSRAAVAALLGAVLLAAGATQPASAAAPSGKKVERTVRALFEKYPLRSARFGVWVKGRPLVSGALGHARPGVPATLKDHFRVGNVGESMTVTLMFQLVEEGRLSLDDPLSTWFPNLPQADEVTVDMLARSTSGYAHYGAHPDFVEEVSKNPHRRWKTSEILDLAFSLPPLFDPGTSWAFSDTNFVLLGKVLRRAGGTPVEQQLRERIWNKLGLDETAMRTDAFIETPAVHGYTRQRGEYEDATSWSPSTFRRAGNVTSTLRDLGVWARALGAGSLVSRQSHALQTGSRNVGLGGQTEDFHYAMGSGITNGWVFNNPNLFGYRSVVAYLPAKDIAVVISSTIGPGAKEPVRYDQGMFNRIGELLAPKQAPDLTFCLDPPCTRKRG